MSDNKHPIRVGFNAKKAAQAANKLLTLSNGERNYMELVKLLYLADREAWLRFECPITGDRMAALPHGLVLSHILNLIRCGPGSIEDGPWFDVVSAPFDYKVKSLQPFENDELSGAEERLLEEIFSLHGRKDWRQLSILTHRLPEWTDPNGSSLPVSPEQLLKLEKRSNSDIERIAYEFATYARLDDDLEASEPDTELVY
ncbi:MAG TPA: Panacea domain-containing protein [Candidatus Baltobacteraceae bacterium]|jgi:hypothetical protein|nr:Panacea domain-containing protein [Candidatus Baltobacteraceae bacterium]